MNETTRVILVVVAVVAVGVVCGMVFLLGLGGPLAAGILLATFALLAAWRERREIRSEVAGLLEDLAATAAYWRKRRQDRH